MPADLPDSLPDEIADIIYKKWGDMAAFARHCKIFARSLNDEYPDVEYCTVYSVLVRSQHHPLRYVERIATGLSVEFDVIASILVLPSAQRASVLKKMFEDKGVRSERHTSRVTGISPADIHQILSPDAKLCKLFNIVVVSMSLGLKPSQFRSLYQDELSAVS